MRYFALILITAVIAYLATCALRKSDASRTEPVTVPETITVLKPLPATVNKDTRSSVTVNETMIAGKAASRFEFTRAQFVSETHGWVMSSHSLYRTTDGGKTWERLSQEPEKDARFNSFSFVNESRGWLSIVKNNFADHYGVGISSVIMVTQDGGRSWKSQASFSDEMEIKDVRFLNANDGLAVGFRGLDKRPDRGELFLLRTTNGGENWNDISGPAKDAFRNQWGVANDAGKFIQWTPSSLLLLTQGGRIMTTTDDAKTWNTLVIFKDERPGGFISSLSYQKLVFDPEQRMGVVAAASGDEGYWGDLIVNENDTWTSYELNLTPIFDAVFLSEKDVLACGMSLQPVDERAKKQPNAAGVVLRSFDRGNSWQTIYRSKSEETFFAIARLKNNDFYAVSDIGTFLRFTLPQ